MTTSRSIGVPLWATLLTAVVAAMVSYYFVFARSSEAAPAADGSPSPKVVGGKPVPDGKYPFMAFLDIVTPQGGLSCAGTLIDPDSVLTAAHCLSGKKTGEPFGKVRVEAYVGRTVRSSNQGQVRSVKTAYIHQDFNPNRFVYDAAVLELRRPVSGIEPIELATSSQNVLERPGRGATVAGWGNTIAQVDQVPGGSEIPDRLLEAQVPIVSDSRADKAYAEYVPPLIIAAGGKNNKTTCQGDSGGPLFSALASDSAGENGDGDNGGKYTQIGITSSGPGGCLVKGTPPAVFTELNNPSVRSFITSAASK